MQVYTCILKTDHSQTNAVIWFSQVSCKRADWSWWDGEGEDGSDEIRETSGEQDGMNYESEEDSARQAIVWKTKYECSVC